MLEPRQVATYYGPNPYASAPVIVADVRIPAELAPKIEVLCTAFQAHFPEWFEGLAQSFSSPQALLGETLSRWALGALNEVRGYLDAAGAAPNASGARVWLGFHEERISWGALQLGARALSLADRPDFSRSTIERELTALLQACRERHPDYQAHILMQAARVRDVPVRPFIQGSKYWQYGWGSRARVFMECGAIDSGGGRKLGDKIASKAVFSGLGAPTPQHSLVQSHGELERAAQTVGWPCVVKPVSASKGTGVTAGIRTPEQLRTAFDEARRYTRDPVMVEAFVPGQDHRLLVAEGRFIRAIRREPSFVVGDGSHSVAQLVQALNRTRTDNIVKSQYLRRIPLDDVLRNHLAGQGTSVEAVPPAGTRITLRSNANISTGGICTDTTEIVHPDTARMAELIVQSMGMKTAGLDYITTDIGSSFLEVGGFIEINSNPGLGMLMAAGNDPVAIGTHVLGEKPGRIPLTLVVLPGEQLPEAVNWLQSQSWPADTAWACGRSAAVGRVRLKISQSRPWPAVDAVLKHQAVASAIIFCSDRDLMLGGLPVDRADRILMCGVDLPAAWDTVVLRHATHVARPADWRRSVIEDALVEASASSLEASGPVSVA